MDISSLIRTRRKELDMTLLDVAKIVGVSEGTVQRWEAGKIANLKHSRLTKLAEALKIPPARLMGWDLEQSTELDELGVQWVDLIHDMRDAGLTPKEVRELIEAVKKIKKS